LSVSGVYCPEIRHTHFGPVRLLDRWKARTAADGVAQQTLGRGCPNGCFMSEHQKQAAFLKGLMMYEDTAENPVLTARLTNAEKNEHCLHCACRLVGLIAMLGLAGLGYSSVLLPQFFDSSTHLVVHLCGAVGLGSLMCLVVFLGLWLWYRKAVNRIHDE